MHDISARDRQAIAARVDLNDQYLYQCLTGRRKLSPERCPEVEKASDGRLSCEALRPDVAWLRVPDPAWPHPSGRPLHDVAVASEAARHAA